MLFFASDPFLIKETKLSVFSEAFDHELAIPYSSDNEGVITRCPFRKDLGK